MGCFKYKGVDYDKETFLIDLKKELKGFNLNGSINVNSEGSGFLLIPDMVTKMEVNILGDKFDFTYKELFYYIKTNIGETNPATRIANALDGKDESLKITVPVVSNTFTKKFHSFDLNGLSSDTLVEATVIKGPVDVGRTIIGTVDFINEVDFGEESIIAFSVINKAIENEDTLNGYSYKTKDGQDIETTEESIALFEMANGKPKNKKYSNSIVAIYLIEKGYSDEEIKQVINNYNSFFSKQILIGETTVKDFTNEITDFLGHLNINKKVLSEEDKKSKYKQRVIDNEFENKYQAKKKEYYAALRYGVIKRILEGDFNFTPSEIISAIPNIAILDIDENHTIKDIEGEWNTTSQRSANIKAYFFNKEYKTKNHLKKAPSGNLLASLLDRTLTLNNMSDEEIATLLKRIVGEVSSNDYSDWPWLKDFQDYLLANKNTVSFKEMKSELSKLHDKMNYDVSEMKLNGYEKSLISVYTRIPSQAKQSTSVGKLVDFTNKRKNFAAESLKSFVIKGEDSDGDKLNTMSVELDMHGNPVSYLEYLNDNGQFDGLNNNEVTTYNEKSLTLLNEVVFSKLLESNKDVLGFKEKLDNFILLRSGREKLDLKAKLELKELESWLAEELNKIEILKVADEAFSFVKSTLAKIDDNPILKQKLDKLNSLKLEENRKDFSYKEALTFKPKDEGFDRARNFIKSIDNKYNKLKEKEINLFVKAVNNYILDSQIAIHSDPLNAIEKEIKVASEEIDNIIDAGGLSDDERFENNIISPDIQGPQAQVKVIHVGDNEIPKVANALRLAASLSELGHKVYSSNPNSKLLDLNKTIDLSYAYPSIDEKTGERKYITKEILIDKIKPFDEAKRLTGLDLAKEHNNTLDLRKTVELATAKYNKDAGIIVTENDVTLFFLDNKDISNLTKNLEAGDIDFSEFVGLLYGTQTFEALSELMTAAVDNAKLLILGKLGITSTLHSHVLTMINLGVSLRDTLAIISQKDIQDAITYYENNNNINKKGKRLTDILKEKAKIRASVNNKTKAKITEQKSNTENLILFKELQLLNNTVFQKEISFLTDSSSDISSLENVSPIVSKYSNITTSVVEGINNADTGLIIVDDDENAVLELKKIAELLDSNKSVFFSTRSGSTVFMYKNGIFSRLKNNEGVELGLNDLVLGGDIYIYNDTDMNSNSVSSLLNMVDNAKFNLSNNIDAFYSKKISNLTEKLKEKLNIINPDFNPAEKFLNLMEITTELSLVVNIMGFKNGKNNSQLDMRNYINRIEGKAKQLLDGVGEKTLAKDFTIYNLLFNKDYQSQVLSIFNMKKIAVNPFLIIIESEELYSYLKTFAIQEHELTLTSKQKENFDILDKRILRQSVKLKTYSNLKKAVESLKINDFFDSYFKGKTTLLLHGIKDKKGTAIRFKLNSIEGSVEFLKSAPKMVQSLQALSNKSGYYIENKITGEKIFKNYNTNPFIQNLEIKGTSSDEFGESLTFVKLGKDFKENESVIKAAAEELKEHNPELYKALYFYDLMISNNSSSTDGLSNVLNPDKEYSIEEFLNDYDFSKISRADENYLILTRPTLVRDLDKTSIVLNRTKGLVFNTIKLSYKNKSKLFTSVPIVRTSALNSYRPFLTKEQISGVKEKNGKVLIPAMPKVMMLTLAGYKLGHQVKVNNNPNNDELRVIAFNPKEDKYFLYNYSNSTIEERTTFELKDLNPDFIFDKNTFGPKSITNEVVLDKKVFLSEKEKKAYFANNANKKIVAIYDESWEKYQKGQTIDSFADAHGRVFNVVYNGTINYTGKNRANHDLGNVIPVEGQMNKVFFKEELVKGMKFDENTKFVLADVVEVTGFNIPIKSNYARLSNDVIKKYSLTRQLTKLNLHERALMVYASAGILEEVSSVKYAGIEKYIRTKDRNYILRSNGFFKTPQEAIEFLGFGDGEAALNQLADYLNIDEYDKNNKTFIYKWLNQTSKEENIQGIILFDAIPQPLRGFNDTKSELDFASNLDLDVNTVETILNGTEIYLETKYISSVNVNDNYSNIIKHSNFNKKGIDVFVDVSDKVTADLKIMKEKSEVLKNANFSNNRTTEKELVRKVFDKLSGTDLNIVYVDNILTISSSDILSNATFNLRNAAIKSGKITYDLLISDLDFLLKEYKNNDIINFDKDYKGEYSYIPVDLRSKEALLEAKGELDTFFNTSYGEVGNNSKGKVGIEQKVFTSKNEKSFITLQTAKHISHNENTLLYVIDKMNGQMFLYDNKTGNTKPINEIPNIAGKKVGMFADNNDVNNILKLSAHKKEMGMDPGFMYYNNFIYNNNEEVEPHTLINTFVNPVNVKVNFDEIELEAKGNKTFYRYADTSISGKLFTNNDFVDLGNDFELKEYGFKSGNILVLESEGSPYVYLINNGESSFEDVRTKDLDYIGEGSLKENYKIKFKLLQNNKELVNHTMFLSAKGIYKVDKQAFVNATNSDGENAILKTQIDNIKAFSTKRIEGTEYSFKDILSSVKNALPELDNEGNIVYAKNITSATDLISFIRSGKFDSLLNDTLINVNGVHIEYETLKKDIIKLNNDLRILKESYYKKIKDFQDKNSPTINMITSSDITDINKDNLVKVYFNKSNSYKDEIVKANNSDTFKIKTSELGNTDKVFSITVADQFGPFNNRNLDIKVSNFFKTVERFFKKNPNSEKVFFVNFNDIDELYKGTSFSFIAKSFARKLKNANYYKLVKEGKIKFNDKATVEINSTDGYNSVSDINSNRIFKTVTVMNPESVMKLPYNFHPQYLELNKETGKTILQEFNEYYSLSENNSNLNKPIEQGDNTFEDVQVKLTQLYRKYFKANPDKLLTIQKKMKSRDLFVYKQNSVTPQTAIIDIINDKNSIDFLFNKNINASDLDFFDTNKRLFLLRENQSLPGVQKESDNSIPVTSSNGDIYKVEYKYTDISPLIETEAGEDINPILKSFGFSMKDIVELTDLKVNEKLSVVVSSKLETDFELVEDVDYDNKKIIEEGVIVPNSNLGEDNIIKANYVFVLNVKNTTTNNDGLIYSNDLKPYLNAYGNVIKTKLTENDVIHIKSSHVGDMEGLTNHEYYDAFIKMKPYLDNMTTSKVKIILSKGVTVNEYIKEYLYKNGYIFDKSSGMFIYKEIDYIENNDGVLVYKYLDTEKEGNRIFAINNNERGKTLMPLILHLDPSKAISYINDFIINEDNKIDEESLIPISINTDKLVHKNSIINDDIKLSILDTLFKDRLSKANTGAAETFINRLEQKAVGYIKVAIGLHLFGKEIDFSKIKNSDDLFIAINNYIKANNDNPIVKTYKDTLANYIDTDNKLTVGLYRKTSMLYNNNNINEFLLQDIGLNYKTMFNDYPLLQEINTHNTYLVNFNTKKQVLVTTYNINDFKSEDVTVLDLFLFAMSFNPETSFTKGTPNPIATMHLFTSNGIEGIDLDANGYSLFDTMDFKYDNDSEPIIYGPKFNYKPVSKNIENLYFNLNKTDVNLAYAINNTKMKNLPFVVSGDEVIFDNKTIISVNDVSKFKNELRKVVLIKALNEVGITTEFANEMLQEDVGANIMSIFKTTKSFNYINTNRILFRGKTDKELSIENIIPGNIISVPIEGSEEVINGLIFTKNNKNLILFNNGNIKEIVNNEGSLYLKDVNTDIGVSFDKNNKKMSITEGYAVPDIGTYGKIRIFNHTTNTYNELNTSIEVLSTGIAIVDNNSYNYNSVYGAWELISSDFGLTFGSKKVLEGTSYKIVTNEELKDITVLSLDNGFVIRLSEDAEIINGDIIDGNKTYEYNEHTLSYKLKIDNESYFKFKSDINEIKINGNTIEAIRLSNTQAIKAVNEISKMYPDIDIKLLSSREIAFLYGESKVNKKGFVKGGEIVYNTDLLTGETFVHEFAHIYIENLKQSNIEAYNELKLKAKSNTALVDQVRKAEPDLNEDELLEEVIVTMIGFNSQGVMTNLTEEKSLWKSILDFFNNLINGIFGIDNTSIDLNKSLEDITKEIGSDIINNKSNLFNTLDNKELIIMNDKASSSSIKEGALRKLISIGNIRLKSDIDYTKIENVKCN